MEKSGHAFYLGLLQHFIVGDMVLPRDSEYAPETAHMEGAQSFLLFRVQGPGFAGKNEGAKHACSVYGNLGVDGQLLIAPYSL